MKDKIITFLANDDVERKNVPVSISTQYHQAVEYSPNPVFTVDRQGIIQTWNLACQQLFQFDSTEIIGQSCRILLWQKTDYEAVQLRVEQVFNAEIFQGIFLTFQQKDSQRLLLHARFYPVKDDDGQPVLCSIACTNLTEQFELERLLHSREHQFQVIFDASPIGTELFDAQEELLEANPACLEIFGVDDIAELRHFQLFHDPSMPEDVRSRLQSGQVVRAEQTLDFDRIKAKGIYPTVRSGRIFLDVLITPILNNNRCVAGYLVQLTDVTNYRQTQQQLAEYEQFLFSLNEISRTALESADMVTMLHTLAHRICELFEADSCSVNRWDEETGQLTHATAPETAGKTYENLQMGPNDQTLTVSALQEGRVLLIDDVYNTPWLSRRIAHQIPDESVIVIPLIADNTKLGATIVGFHRPRQFTKQEIMKAEQTARHLSLAIAKADYLAQAQRRLEEAEMLRRVMAVVNSSLDLDKTIATILEQLEQIIPYDSASVQLLRNDSLEIVYGRYLPSVVNVGTQFPIPGDNPNTLVVKKRQPVLLNYPALSYSSFKRVHSKYIQCWLGVPLIRNDQIIGMISLDGNAPHRFTSDHVRLVTILADHIAIALENAQLHQQIKQDAATKNTLLREVNHRVQNNMAAILGLLSLEKRRWDKTGDLATRRDILEDMYHRIQGMGAAHKMLSGSAWSPVLLSDLCRQIINAALKPLPSDKHIAVDIAETPVRVTAKQATALALIINELVTNTIKYGIQNRRQGHIRINISLTDDDTIVFEFRDDGPGYAPDVVDLKQYNVGIQITRILASNELQGELILDNDNGAVTIIRFPSDIS